MKICKSEKCTGCGVCADACPKKCISIKYDEKGFYKSYIDESLCVSCNRCKDVCPANHPNKKNRIQKAYKARRTDKYAASASTSGGIASVLSEYIIKNGGVVVGCGYDENMCLKHSIATSLDEIENFKGSKYVQSYASGIYRKVRDNLSDGKKVLFVGTPCQVAAVKNYLGKNYDNLYTVDFVCHGVLSQYAFEKYINSLNHTEKPVSIKFRNKTKGYRNKKACSEIQIEYPVETIRAITESGVYYWFSSSLAVRESCYKCSFVSPNRVADITLADYIGNDLDDTDNEIGVNTVFVNTDKGCAMLESVKSEIIAERKNVGETIKKYVRLTMGSKKPSCREEFYTDLFTTDYNAVAKKYNQAKVLPNKMVRRYYSMKRRIRNLFIR